MTLTEMQGLLRGQCLPGDLKVNEDLAEYLLRQFKERDDKIAALAAESAVLKKFCKNASFDADYAAELGMERGGFTDAMNDIKTPATDAAIAELKAQQFEWAEAVVRNEIGCLKECAPTLRNMACLANHFHNLASELRKEAK